MTAESAPSPAPVSTAEFKRGEIVFDVLSQHEVRILNNGWRNADGTTTYAIQPVREKDMHWQTDFFRHGLAASPRLRRIPA